MRKEVRRVEHVAVRQQLARLEVVLQAVADHKRLCIDVSLQLPLAVLQRRLHVLQHRLVDATVAGEVVHHRTARLHKRVEHNSTSPHIHQRNTRQRTHSVRYEHHLTVKRKHTWGLIVVIVGAAATG
ncbi:hypothetical protein DQ04_06831050 [Trypanosoma grayi]|uniref:hypothetical protein n=1 Tax=Trypanosoma grayi TaxID=71804 RepID=UPI0004F4422D|nr:hypothetical protein DQ04_06831050 [Trypanosoma grayi]KEG08603.1 hypothetical protein DQ04_06831050 [Trypanosoma grayi]